MLKKLPAAFYASSSGTEPVRDWLRALDPADRLVVGKAVAKAEYGWPIGMPACRHLGEGLFEIRSRISGGRIARVMFVVVDERMWLLHAFVKKAQKTPKQDLDLALRRRRELLP